MYFLRNAASVLFIELESVVRLWTWLSDMSVEMQNISHIFKCAKCVEIHTKVWEMGVRRRNADQALEVEIDGPHII